jgi:hypothetical protein
VDLDLRSGIGDAMKVVGRERAAVEPAGALPGRGVDLPAELRRDGDL